MFTVKLDEKGNAHLQSVFKEMRNRNTVNTRISTIELKV